MTLISHQYRFAYVHIYKAGGTSVTNALMQYARLRERIANNTALGKKLFYAVNEIQNFCTARSLPAGTSTWYMGGISKHASLEQVVKFLGPKSVNYKIFATFRNPLSWVFSQYSYIRMRPLHSMHKQVSSQTLADFVTQFIAKESRLQSDIIKPHPNGRHIDCVVQLEKFDTVATRLFEFLAIPSPPPALRRLNSSSRESTHALSSSLQSKLENYLAPDMEIYAKLMQQKGILFYDS